MARLRAAVEHGRARLVPLQAELRDLAVGAAPAADEWDIVASQSYDSFPASDAPSWTGAST